MEHVLNIVRVHNDELKKDDLVTTAVAPSPEPEPKDAPAGKEHGLPPTFFAAGTLRQRQYAARISSAIWALPLSPADLEALRQITDSRVWIQAYVAAHYDPAATRAELLAG